MPPDGCSACMSIVIITSKLRGAKQDSVPYMVKIILTHIPVESGAVDPYVDRMLNGSGKAMVLPPSDDEVIRVGAMS